MRGLRLVLAWGVLAIGACGGDGGGPARDAGSDASADTACLGVDCCERDEDCDNGLFCDGVERCSASVCVSGDSVACDDSIACTEDICDENNNSCAFLPSDEDDDGHTDASCLDLNNEPLGDDCDDLDAQRFPGNHEACDAEGVDEDCDPRTFGAKDDDGDRSIDGACFNVDNNGTRFGGLDCDDSNLAIHGRQLELCDGLDNDCDLIVDEYPTEVAWYLDADGDGFGAGSDVLESCMPLSGRSILGTDCADDAPSVHPAAVELCDGLDNDCDLGVDESLTDCNTTGEPVVPIVDACLNGLDDCNEYALCTDSSEGFTCTCGDGFRGDGHGPAGCRDINECAAGAVLACGVGATSCLNGLGSYACFCGTGFGGTGSPACTDIDECLVDNGGCDSARTCTNSAPGRTCDACSAGYVAVGATACAPVLTSLTPSAGVLAPMLTPSMTDYVLRAGLVNEAITLIPTAAPGVTITINGQLVVSGSVWQSPSLSLGDTVVGIVLSEPQRPARYYTLTIRRPAQVTYAKASFPDSDDVFGAYVSLSDDGNTLAVSATEEDSAATGVNGDASDNTASSAGAVFVFQRTSTGWMQQAYLKASNAEANDRYGRSVVLSGDGNTLAVNGYFEDSASGGINGDQSNNAATDSGAVYIYSRSGSTWTQTAYIKTDTPLGIHLFGNHLSLSYDGNVLVAGAVQDDSGAAGVFPTYRLSGTVSEAGAAYVFERSSGVWAQTAYLKASNPGSLDYFGGRVVVSRDGSTIAVSAQGEASNATGINGDQANNTMTRAGAVYMFVRGGTSWQQQAYVKAPNPDAQDNFGSSLSLSADGNVLAAGALGEASNAPGINGLQSNNAAAGAGAVYLFSRSGVTWTTDTYVKASNTGAADAFGAAVALSSDGTRLAVGATGEASAASGVDGNQFDNTRSGAGAVYLFARDAGGWTQTTYVKSENPDSGDSFGQSVALSTDGVTLAVGAPNEDSATSGVDGTANNDAADTGAVYVF